MGYLINSNNFGFFNIDGYGNGNSVPAMCFSGRTVGINTKTPQATLDVDGNAIIRTSLQVNGSASITGNISFSYSTLPTLSSTSLGYTINYSNTATNLTAGAFVNSSVISVPVGIYIVQGYANFTATAQNVLKLGINTTTSTFSNTYNYTTNVNPSTSQIQSINYTYYLTVATTTNFYFVFSTGVAGTLGGSLNGKFIRIA
jgi:hypothetical protein